MGSRRNHILLGLVVLLLLLGGLGALWVLSIDDGATHRPNISDDSRQNSDIDDADNPVDNAEPAIESEKIPEPEGVRPPGSIELPDMSRFRALVLEADTALELQGLVEEESEPESCREPWLVLKALGSDLAAYGKRGVESRLTVADKRLLEAEIGTRFLRPDVASESWLSGGALLESPKSSNIWQRSSLKMPKAEVAADEIQGVPLVRRRHEDLREFRDWFRKIEAEYGRTSFNRDNPMDFVLLDDAEFRTFSSRRLKTNVSSWTAGYYSPDWQVAVVRVASNLSTAEVVRHESFHALQYDLAPASLGCLWFSEGSAEWMDKAAFDSGFATLTDYRQAAMGYLRALLTSGWELNLSAFLTMDRGEFYANPTLHYLYAYSFVDYLLTKDTRTYWNFWRELKRGASVADALAKHFPTDEMPKTESNFRAYLMTVPARFNPPGVKGELTGRYALDKPTDKPIYPMGVDPKEFEWRQKLEDLREHGFNPGWTTPIRGDFDTLVVVVDSSPSMNLQITTFSDNEWNSFTRWLFALRLSGTLQLTNKTTGESANGQTPEVVTLMLVDSVVLGKEREFTLETGISIHENLSKKIKQSWKGFQKEQKSIKHSTRRELALLTAQSMAWYWQMNQEQGQVSVVDFNITMQKSNVMQSSGQRRHTLQTLFKETETNQHDAIEYTPPGSDTDWWLGLNNAIGAASDVQARRAAVLFFTDGACNAGPYQTTAPEDAGPQRDKLAEDVSVAWRNAGMDHENRPSRLQLIGVPGADVLGLNAIAAKVPEARVSDWSTQFKD